MNKLRIVLTGSTGMVGEGVLMECLQHDEVESVLLINRRSSGIHHTKLKEILHDNFNDISGIADKVREYNACFFCAGVSSVGKKEEEFEKLTYTLTINFADGLKKSGADFVFCYISGAGTDSTEKGRTMWARIKGRTENQLMKMGFRSVYNFRPGILTPSPGMKNTLSYYKYFGWLAPLIRLIAPNSISSLKELGLAMIHASLSGYTKNIIEVSDIHHLANVSRQSESI